MTLSYISRLEEALRKCLYAQQLLLLSAALQKIHGTYVALWLHSPGNQSCTSAGTLPCYWEHLSTNESLM